MPLRSSEASNSTAIASAAASRLFAWSLSTMICNKSVIISFEPSSKCGNTLTRLACASATRASIGPR